MMSLRIDQYHRKLTRSASSAIISHRWERFHPLFFRALWVYPGYCQHQPASVHGSRSWGKWGEDLLGTSQEVAVTSREYSWLRRISATLCKKQWLESALPMKHHSRKRGLQPRDCRLPDTAKVQV